MTCDIFDTNIQLLEKYYNCDNYKIENINLKNNNTLLCFSSHAAYFPFSEQDFITKILKNDRYEYNSLSQNKMIRKFFGKIIYARDLYREWYVNGVNSRCNSISKFIEELKERTIGEDVYTLGTSSGGYLATIAGLELKAKAIFTMSGQFSLKKWQNRKYLTMYKDDNQRNRYFDITNMLKSDIPIFYFCPYNSQDDREQYNLVKDVPNVYSFLFEYNDHGHTIDEYIIQYMFTKQEILKTITNDDTLLYTSEAFKNKLLGVWKFKDIKMFFCNKKHKKFIKDVI